jgi:Domain of unknown function (DUF4410)
MLLIRKSLVALVLAVATIVITGCASTPGSVKGADNVSTEARVGSRDTVAVKVSKGATEMLEVDAARLAQLVQREIDAYKVKNASKSANEMKYRVEVDMLTYDKGNAFARFMLAGIGQVKLNAKVSVIEEATNKKVSEFVADKVFAWGGIYGGSQGITDVEPAFAEAIAQGATGVQKKD